MNPSQQKTLGGLMILVGGVVLAGSSLLPWWQLCVIDVCDEATGLDEWPGMVAFAFGFALLVLGIVILANRDVNRGVALGAGTTSIVSVLLSLLSIVKRDALVGIDGLALTPGPFVALIASGIAVVGGLILLRTTPAISVTPPPPVSTDGFTA